MEIYNAKAAAIDIRITVGDTLDLSFSVKKNSLAYDMTGMQLDMQVKKVDGTVVKTLSSIGESPGITISEDNYVVKATPFTEAGRFRYDVQLTSGLDIFTIQAGRLFVVDEITT